MGKASCHTCIYACWDLGQAMLSMSTGFASRPMCANHPDAPARMQPTPIGNTCRNYRPKPPTPQGDVRQIPLGGGMYAYVDAADYEWLSQYTWYLYAGGYAARVEKNRIIYMHREIMKPPKGMVVDHIDGNRANDCRANLRVCTRTENLRNNAKRRDASSRFKGVGYDKQRGKYYAKCAHKGERPWLGYFDDDVEAARAYDRKAVEYYGPFARLNLPEEWPPERVRQVYAEYQARLEREGEKGRRKEGKNRRTEEGKSRRGEKRRGEEGKRRTEDGRRRTAGEKKVRRSEGKKVRRTRKVNPARRVSAGRRTRVRSDAVRR